MAFWYRPRISPSALWRPSLHMTKDVREMLDGWSHHHCPSIPLAPENVAITIWPMVGTEGGGTRLCDLAPTSVGALSR